MKKVVLFGIGSYYEKNKTDVLTKYQVVGLVDNNIQRVGVSTDGMTIQTPDILGSTNFDEVIILAKYDVNIKEMYFQVKSLGVPNEKIKIWKEAMYNEEEMKRYRLLKDTSVNERVIACERNGLMYILPTHCYDVTDSVYVSGSFDQLNIERFFKLSEVYYGKQQGAFLDIGANIGTESLIAAQNPCVTHVYAFEPHPFNYKLLTANVCLNSMTEKITTVNAAVGKEQSESLLSICDINSVDHRVVQKDEKNDINEYEEEKRSVISIKTIALNDYFAHTRDVIDIAYMWVDTQGYEYFVLSGAEKIIKSNTAVLIEFWPYQMRRNNSLDKMIEHLKKHFSHYLIMQEISNSCIIDMKRIKPVKISEIENLVLRLLSVSKNDFNDAFVDLFLLRL